MTLKALYDYEMHNWCILNEIKLTGIYMADKIFDMYNNTCYIFNLGDSDTIGTHWVGAYVTSDVSYYFDSFGNRPDDRLVRLLKRDKRDIVYNDNILQSINSASCGYFVLLWLFFVSKGVDTFDAYYKYVYEVFHPDDEHNEEVIKNIFSSRHKQGGDVQALVTRILPNTELHLPVYVDGKIQKASFAGPGTRLDDRIDDLDQVVNDYPDGMIDVNDPRILTKPKTSLDEVALNHDIAYYRTDKKCEGDKKCIIKGKHKADEMMIAELKNNLRHRRYTNRVDALQSLVAVPILKSKIKLGIGI